MSQIEKFKSKTSDSPSKSQSLMNYDIMQIFGLRILSVLLSCLDTLLYFVDTHDIITYLLQCQEDCKVEGKVGSEICLKIALFKLYLGCFYFHFLRDLLIAFSYDKRLICIPECFRIQSNESG